jgi:voltage-gated potassium channel
MLVAALLVIPVVVIEQSSFGQPWEAIGAALNWAIWLAFLGELVVMLAVVDDRSGWLRKHPLELLIVVLTPPFLASTFAAVRALRLLRLVRLLRLAQLARDASSMEGLRYVSLLALLTVLAGGAGYASVERHQSLGDGMYWAITTMTTVGYGDLSPQTTTGKFLAVVMMLVGIGFVAILTGAVAQRFLAAEIREDVAAIEHEIDAGEDALLGEIREISARLQRLEASLQRARRGS